LAQWRPRAVATETKDNDAMTTAATPTARVVSSQGWAAPQRSEEVSLSLIAR
jgi:hypothetical protein